MKLTSLLRLSFAALLLTAATAQAYTQTFNLSDIATAGSGWNVKLGSNGTGYYFTADNGTVESPVFSTPIISITFHGHRTPSCTRIIAFDAGSFSTNISIAAAATTTASDFYTKSFAPNENVTSFSLKNKSGGQNFYIKKFIITFADPAPVFADIVPNTKAAQVDQLLSFDLSVSSFTGDTVTCTATPNKAITGTYGITGTTFSYTPSAADEALSPVTFTVDATGNGGTTTKSFVVTVASASAKMPPSVTVPVASAEVLALRTLSFPVTITEPDGDSVTTNLEATSSSALANATLVAGIFSYTPAVADIEDSPITFTVKATDTEGTGQASFTVTVLPAGTPPVIAKIATNTVYFGSVITNTLSLTETDGDPITLTNVITKGTAPAGTLEYFDGKHVFIPAAGDIGQIFTFEAQAVDCDGMGTREFAVKVGLAAPVINAMTIADITPSSFTVSLDTPTPAATGYLLSYTNYSQNVTGWSEEIPVAEFPYTVSELDTAYYGCRVRAVSGVCTSAWSKIVVYPLSDYAEKVVAIKLTDTHRKYTQNFDDLGATGYWFDGRSLPGWYAVSSTDGCIDGYVYPSYEGGTDDGCLISGRVSSADPSNRAFGARPAKHADSFSIGVVFTNTCTYAVTNITVKFTGMQFRKYAESKHTTYTCSYAKNADFFDLSTAGITWTTLPALTFGEIATGKDGVDPALTVDKSGSIALDGDNALQPGETIAIKWFVYADQYSHVLGIDDLEVTWKCAWPARTLIIVQ